MKKKILAAVLGLIIQSNGWSYNFGSGVDWNLVYVQGEITGALGWNLASAGATVEIGLDLYLMTVGVGGWLSVNPASTKNLVVYGDLGIAIPLLKKTEIYFRVGVSPTTGDIMGTSSAFSYKNAIFGLGAQMQENHLIMRTGMFWGQYYAKTAAPGENNVANAGSVVVDMLMYMLTLGARLELAVGFKL